jgi:GMP synthase-like glutamine amidotransferase
MKILIIQNCAGENLGLINELLEEQKIPFQIVRPYLPEEFPPANLFSGMIIGGTPDSV